MSAFGKFTLGFILGGLASTGISLLYTPKSGIELRDQIKGYIDNVQAEVQKAQEDRRKEMKLELETLQHPTE